VQSLKVSVAEILGKPGTYRDITVSEVLPDIGNALSRLTDDPVNARLRAESVVEGVLVTGPVETQAEFECARCLTKVTDSLLLDVCELYVGPGQDVPPEEDAYRVDGLEIDLEPMLRDAVTLALPLRPVCREDCRGICARCGQDLNQGPCDCKDDEMDPRWAALTELRDKLA
jgi:uncharacterized protein